MAGGGKKGIVFMHGGGMGKWIWKRIEPLIKFPYIMPARWDASLNLPAGKVTAKDCINHVISSINAAGFEEVLLVAHSGSGVMAPAVAAGAMGRIKHILYVAASVPPQGRNALDMLPLVPKIMNMIMIALMPDGYRMPKKSLEKTIRNYFCNDCDESVISYVLENELVPEPPAIAYFRVDRAGMPAVPCTYLRTLKDKTASAQLQAKMAGNAGCRIVDFDSGHMPMLSRPEEFAALVNGLV